MITQFGNHELLRSFSLGEIVRILEKRSSGQESYTEWDRTPREDFKVTWAGYLQRIEFFGYFGPYDGILKPLRLILAHEVNGEPRHISSKSEEFCAILTADTINDFCRKYAQEMGPPILIGLYRVIKSSPSVSADKKPAATPPAGTESSY